MTFDFTFLQEGLAPLNLAAERADKIYIDAATVRLLLEKGADVNVASKVWAIF